MATFARTEEALELSKPARRLRLWLLIVIAADLGLVAVRVATYQAFLSMPGALGYLMPAVVALAVSAAVVGTLPLLASRSSGAAAAVQVGALVGLIGGAIDMASITMESVLVLPQNIVAVATLVAMVSLFLSFGVAGFLGGRGSGSFRLGVGAAVWSAVVAILIAVTFGFLLVNTSLPKLGHDEIGDPDYARSGWTDVRAFAIANTLSAGFTHLVEGPVIAAVLGAAGSGIGQLGAGRRAGRQG
jgi:hypothetical protein